MKENAINVGQEVYLEPRGNYLRLHRNPEYDPKNIGCVRPMPFILLKGTVTSIARLYLYVTLENGTTTKVNKKTLISSEADCNASYALWLSAESAKLAWEASEKRRLLADMLKQGFSAYAPLSKKVDEAVSDEMVLRMWDIMTGKREFYIDTPLGKLHVWSKHDGKDCPADYPGVYVDAPPAYDGSSVLLACVEYCPEGADDPTKGYLQTCTYGNWADDAPTHVEHHILPTKEEEEEYLREVEAEAETQDDVPDESDTDSIT